MEVFQTAYGASLVSRNIYEEKGRLTWCIREAPARDIDNGWRFLSDIDTEEYLNNPDNWCILPYEKIIALEPAVLTIYDMPIGTELTIYREKVEGKSGERITLVDTKTGEIVPWWLQKKF